MLLDWSATSERPQIASPLTTPVALFLVLTVASMALSSDPWRSANLSVSILPALLLYVVIADFIQCAWQRRWIYSAFSVLSIGIALPLTWIALSSAGETPTDWVQQSDDVLIVVLVSGAKKAIVVGAAAGCLALVGLRPEWVLALNAQGYYSAANKSIAQLSAAWWEWQETNFGTADFYFGDGPVECDVGQSGAVWFLGGSDGTMPVERECRDPIPSGKQLFFPLINLVYFNEPPEEVSVAEKREILSDLLGDLEAGSFNSEACKLDVTVDGQPVIFSGIATQRVQSPLFEYGMDPEAVSDGFWVLLPKLSGGEHTIRFGGSLCEFETGNSIGFDVDVTYVLTISGKHGGNKSTRK
jgi:hypothetical protein